MLGAARLERQLDAGLADLQVDGLADVLDGEQVPARCGDRTAAAPRARRDGRGRRVKTRRRRPTAVSWRRASSASRPASTLPPESTTTVAPSPRPATSSGEQRRDADRPRPLDDELRALHQQHHRLGGVLLADDDDVVDPALDQRQRQLARALDRDAVGDRRRRRRPRAGRRPRAPPGTARRPRSGRRRPRSRGAPSLTTPATPRCRPPPPIGTITFARSGTCSSSSSPSVAWPTITCGSSKGCTKTAPVSLARALRGRDALVDALAAERDEAAVGLDGGDLRDRGLEPA